MSEAPERKEIVRDVDLLKVKIYSDHCHARITTSLSIIFAIYIGLWVLGGTLFFEQTIPRELWYLMGMILTIAVILLLGYILQRDRKEFKNISDMIETIRQGNELPKLEDL